MRVRVVGVEPFTRWMETRFPFRYGIASMTRLPHVFLRVRLLVDGRESVGMSSEGLPPKWFTKNTETRYEEDDLPAMVAVIERGIESAMEAGERGSVFDLWRAIYERVDPAVPPLLAHLGTSLVERGILDACCRGLGMPLGAAVRSGAIGIRLGDVHRELEGREVGDFLGESHGRLTVRHTVGLGDPLEVGDVEEGGLIEDGLPFVLRDCVGAYGLTHFKVKVCGDTAIDMERLGRLGRMLGEICPGYRVTLDGNEQFHDVRSLIDFWGACQDDEDVAGLLSDRHLLFVEQPLHRDVAGEVDLNEWVGRPRVIIDESDGELGSLTRALELGYAGGSHKNCKGVIKGIANACLLKARGGIQSGEDLANVGPVALLQDLAVMALLGVGHVERNGHHYFRGLSMFPEVVQRSAVEAHGDLYRWDDAGFASLAIENGELATGSVCRAAFGCGLDEADGLGEAGMPGEPPATEGGVCSGG